jgi:subtilisin family serine protease
MPRRRFRRIASALVVGALAAGMMPRPRHDRIEPVGGPPRRGRCADGRPTPGPAPGDRAAEYWLDEYGAGAWATTRQRADDRHHRHRHRTRTVEFSVRSSAARTSPASARPTGAARRCGRRQSRQLGGVARGGARTGADTGMIGVAPEASLLSISIGFGASSSVPFVQQVADAMKWAVDHGADIINLSFTTNTLTWDPSWDDAFLYAFDHDVVVVVAAGNKGSDRGGRRAATIPGC